MFKVQLILNTLIICLWLSCEDHIFQNLKKKIDELAELKYLQ